MKKALSGIMIVVLAFALAAALTGCDSAPSSDDTQRAQQEKILAEGTAQIGMPSIKNFREKKLLKDILELRDQTGLVTYTYVENMNPVIVPGRTALGGKLTFMGESVGYGIPYATQFTNPQKVEYHSSSGYVALPQADPNGLFSPASAEGTWIMLRDPSGAKGTQPVYVEPRVVVSPFKYPFDK
jgi:hypothetical protein